ncbi:hypothetical protein BaRGS_00037790 [Batillaria attramentaria]|uniref:CCHC-type domain-containing protein n=1 Tax=Batillaria attramentaria TaxID=370345 RepID=A0ABD0J8I4_9CAEN
MASIEDLIATLRERSQDDQRAILQALAPAAPGDDNSSATAGPQTVHAVTFPPRLALFSGEDKDARYSPWRAEIIGLQANHPESTILQAMRRSVKGLAADVLLHLDDSTTLQTALQKLDQMFGCVQPAEKLYELFYTSKQLPSETAVGWACRLERIVADVRCADRNLATEAADSMLRSKFWSGLASPAMRDALRHRVDSGATFSDILVAARQVEAESGGNTVTHTASAQQPAGVSQQLERIMQRLDNLEKRLPHATFQGKCYKCKQKGHRQADCKNASGNAQGPE